MSPLQVSAFALDYFLELLCNNYGYSFDFDFVCDLFDIFLKGCLFLINCISLNGLNWLSSIEDRAKT